jgi:hypothetical protein
MDPIVFVHPLSELFDGAPVIVLNVPGIHDGHAIALESKMDGLSMEQAKELAEMLAKKIGVRYDDH